MHRDVLGAANEFVRQRAPEQLGKNAVARATNDDLGYVLKSGETQQLAGNVVPDQRFRFGAERLGELEDFIDAVPRRLVEAASGIHC